MKSPVVFRNIHIELHDSINWELCHGRLIQMSNTIRIIYKWTAEIKTELTWKERQEFRQAIEVLSYKRLQNASDLLI